MGLRNDAAFHGARGSVLESLDEPDRAIVAYERALELAPGDGFLLDRLEGLGALKRLTAPDGFAYWLTPADFDRVVRAELAALFEQGAPQLVARGIALAADGHLELARLAGLLAYAPRPGRRGRAGAALGSATRPTPSPTRRAG